jgi:hypothetical protein
LVLVASVVSSSMIFMSSYELSEIIGIGGQRLIRRRLHRDKHRKQSCDDSHHPYPMPVLHK